MFGPELVEALRAFKAIFDPEGRMNPGKVVDPYPPDTNLRRGTDLAVRECPRTSPSRPTRVGGTMCPKLHGHPRGTALHPGPRPTAAGDDDQSPRRPRREEGLARPARQGRVGSVPSLQELQGRLPGERRHGHLQGGVPGPLPRRPVASARSLRVGPDPAVGPTRRARPRAGQLPTRRTRDRHPRQAGGRGGHPADRARVRRHDAPDVVRGASAPPDGRTGAVVARHLHQLLRPRARRRCGMAGSFGYGQASTTRCRRPAGNG